MSVELNLLVLDDQTESRGNCALLAEYLLRGRSADYVVSVNTEPVDSLEDLHRAIRVSDKRWDVIALDLKLDNTDIENGIFPLAEQWRELFKDDA